MQADELQNVWYRVSKLHNNQKYGGQVKGEQIEYINHVASVVFEIFMAIQNTPGMDTNLALHCALLHDTVEDTEFSIDNVKALFGNAIANGVLALTKNDEIEGRLAQMTDSLERIKKQPKEVWAVKMADRICNLYAPPFYWDMDKKSFYVEEAKMILNELKDGNEFLAERLSSKIEQYKKFLH